MVGDRLGLDGQRQWGAKSTPNMTDLSEISIAVEMKSFKRTKACSQQNRNVPN